MPITELLPALPWLAPFATLVRLADRRPNLGDIAPVQGPLVSVVIPARNESETIEAVVHSILSSSYAAFELLVVDDRSTDDTAAIVARLAAGDPRVRLVRGEPLPTGGMASRGPASRARARARGDSCSSPTPTPATGPSC
jgi:cellulose synthase/poly-beta-1,6-N-acetylglucosamine synthase-like glycosyltransferase